MIKIIYIEQPRPGYSREYWARRWRMHGGFAMQFREFWDPVRIYIQNDCVADPSAFAGANPTFGGVGELYYDDLPSCQASLATPNMDAIYADGSQVFGRLEAVHLITELKQIEGHRPGRLRIFAYASRPQGMNRSDFNSRLEDSIAACGAGLSTKPVSLAVAHNVEDREMHESVIDFSFDSPEDAIEGHENWLSVADKDEFLASALARAPLKVITHACIIYDTANFGE